MNAPQEELWVSFVGAAPAITASADRDATRYVRYDIHEEALAYIERMVSEDLADPVSYIVELRFALGDNGTRSLPELLEYAKELAARATRPPEDTER